MTDHNYCSSNTGAETQVSTAAPIEGEVEPEKAGQSRISVNCPSINEIKDIITCYALFLKSDWIAALLFLLK